MNKQELKNLFLHMGLFAICGMAPQLARGQAVAPPPDIAGWWPGDGNFLDIAGTNSGQPIGQVSYVLGKVGQAFNFSHDGDGVIVAHSPQFNMESHGFSAEFWVRGDKNESGVYGGVVDKSHGWTDTSGWVFQSEGGGVITFAVGTGDGWVQVRTGDVLDGVFHHLAATWDGSVIRLYVDGVQQGQTPLTNPTNNSRPLNIGFVWGGGTPTRFFRGQVDELAIFQRALSSDEITSIYAAGSAGMCKNPVITQHPQSQVGYWGKSVTLSITASCGKQPYTYQWRKDGVEIDGATGSQLELTNLQAEDTGSYTVVVKDANNTTLISQAANLTVNPARVGIATYAGLTIEGVIGQTYGIQATTDLGGAGSWAGVANVTLTQPTQIWYDSESTAQQLKRFYRVVAGPISIP